MSLLITNKRRKRVCCAELIIMSPSCLRSNVWKHVGLDSIHGNIEYKGKAVADF